MPDSDPTQSPTDNADEEPGLQLVGAGEDEPLTLPEIWERTSSTFLHPYDDPSLTAQLTDLVPDFRELTTYSVRPKLSDHPDDFEVWESTVILQRSARMSDESARQYLQRWLYEGAFSVQQFPYGAVKDMAPHNWSQLGGMTTGGLLSHYYLGGDRWGETMNILVEDVDWTGNDLQDVYRELQKEGAGKEILKNVLFPLIQMYGQRMQDRISLDGVVSYKDILDGSYRKVAPMLDSISLRLLQMLQASPEMRAEVKDDELVERFTQKDHHRSGRPNKAELLLRTWTASQPLLTPEGTYNKSEDPEVLKVLNDLLYFRTHPETQVFFRYLSPSGYINAARYSAQREKSLE